ncbi:glycosyltransferase [Pedobacter polaris]|uniref:Glycosyltransferase n=1 Tax=Pedobacter polaris TaxID=2571273 RepID=A0A4U1CRC7_9SPHI|nr:glycosyltransferase [Pedobacter polaris]TKC08171.1 glycosyltransferase [Pedobacter polaris]
MRIKILQITAAYKPAHIYGGPTMSVAKLCEVLTENEVELEVLTTTANGKTELNVATNKPQKVDGVTVTYFKRLTKDHTHFSPSLLKKLRHLILQGQNQSKLVIHIHAWWNLISIFSCQIAKWYNIPVVLSPRGMLTNYTLGNRNASIKSIIHSLMGKKLLAYCHIHATSGKEKQDILQFINPKSITVIPNLVELSKNDKYEFVQSLEQESVFKLIFLSRIEEKKGLELLLEALAGLQFDWTLTIAGSGEENYIAELKNKVESLNLNNQINWVGQINNSDKFKLLAEHHLMVLSSYNENFANVVVESLSVGTAVLLSNQVGLADYVTKNDFGWVTDLTSKSIQTNIENAYKDKNKRVEIRKIAPKIVKNDFSSEELIHQYISFYQQVN